MIMANDSDTPHVLNVLRKIRSELTQKNDKVKLQKLDHLIAVLESPLYNQIVTIGLSLDQLAHILEREPLIEEEDFEIDVHSGKLILSKESEQRVNAALTKIDIEENIAPVPVSVAMRVKNQLSSEEFNARVTRMSFGRQIRQVTLYKKPTESFGFNVIGLRGERAYNMGVFIQGVLPNSIAEREGRLRDGDQVLAINHIPLDEETCHDDAIHLLQQADTEIDLLIAESTHGTGILPSSLQSSFSSEYTAKKLSKPLSTVNPAQALLEKKSSVDMLNTEWTQYEIIDLSHDGNGFGFGIIGHKTTGVVVRTILPGGAADRDGRLQNNDHLMYIGQVHVRGMTSEQVASVLRQAGNHVRLIVARPFDQNSGQMVSEPVHIVETVELDRQLEMIVHRMYSMDGSIDEKSYSEIFNLDQRSDSEKDVIKRFDVKLIKGRKGLGITIAGYCSDDPNIKIDGIFIKEVFPDGAAYREGQLQVNDKIIQVDGTSLENMSNQEAVDILKHTGDTVHLKCLRYVSGPICEQLLKNEDIDRMRNSSTSTESFRGSEAKISLSPTSPVHSGSNHFNHIHDDYLDPKIEKQLIHYWRNVFGVESDIVVSRIVKASGTRGMGMSLEGTVDVEEGGKEVRPHHYIRDISQNGPVAKSHKLNQGDELLQANDLILFGQNHREVLSILRELPSEVILVCLRNPHHTNELSSLGHRGVTAHSREPIEIDLHRVGGSVNVLGDDTESDSDSNSDIDERIAKKNKESLHIYDGSLLFSAKSKSEEDLLDGNATHLVRSRSLEPVEGLALWSNTTQIVYLEKRDQGLGFTLMDFQDPINRNYSVVVIKSLVPNGVADLSQNIYPGDRLVSVNGIHLQNATVEQAIDALKSAPRGNVALGIVKPTPLKDSVIGGRPKDGGIKDLLHSQMETMDEISSDREKEESYSEYIPPIPVALEQKIRIKKMSGENIGINLDECEIGPNGILLSSISGDSPIYRDGRISRGDYITNMYGERLRNLSMVQAKTLMRRIALTAGDISISYIPEADAQVHRQTSVMTLQANRLQKPHLSLHSQQNQAANKINEAVLNLQMRRTASEEYPITML